MRVIDWLALAACSIMADASIVMVAHFVSRHW